MKEEMIYYEVLDPYNNDYRYYEKQYLCLWQVDAPEVVGRWNWAELENHRRWYEDIVLPAYNRHEDRRQSALSIPRRLHGPEEDDISGTITYPTLCNKADQLQAEWAACRLKRIQIIWCTPKAVTTAMTFRKALTLQLDQNDRYR